MEAYPERVKPVVDRLLNELLSTGAEASMAFVTMLAAPLGTLRGAPYNASSHKTASHCKRVSVPCASHWPVLLTSRGLCGGSRLWIIETTCCSHPSKSYAQGGLTRGCRISVWPHETSRQFFVTSGMQSACPLPLAPISSNQTSTSGNAARQACRARPRSASASQLDGALLQFQFHGGRGPAATHSFNFAPLVDSGSACFFHSRGSHPGTSR